MLDLGPSKALDTGQYPKRRSNWIGRCALLTLAIISTFVFQNLLRGQRQPSAIQTNLVTNPGFEDSKAGVPTGWNLDEGLRSRGTVRVDSAEPYAGRNSLELMPNGKNTEAGRLFGVGQLIPANGLTGRRLKLQAALRVTGGASAQVLVFAVSRQFKPLAHSVLVWSESGSSYHVLSDLLDVDKDASQILIACAVEGTHGQAWFDDIQVGLENAASADPGVGSPAPAMQTVLEVDATKITKRVSPALFGTNLEWINNANGIWDPAQNRFRPEIVDAAKNLGITTVRFPGGIFADYYHWRDGIGPQSGRAARPHFADDGKSKNVFGTGELVQFCRATGAEPVIQVNIVTGTPDEAADWVSYCNRPNHPERERNGSKEPFRIRYWEIGNEQYGKSDNKNIAKSSLAPEEYASRYLSFAAAMRKADPSIVLIAVGGYNSGRYTAVSNNDWNKILLRRAASSIDFLAVHNAYAPLWASTSGASFEDVYRAMLAFPGLVSKNLNEVSHQIESFAGPSAGHIQIAVTEWGPFFHAIPSDPWVGHTKTLGSALYVASAVQAFLRDQRTEMANFFKLTEPSFMGWIDANGVPKPSYYALQMYTHHFGDRVIAVEVDSPNFGSRSVGNVDAVDRTEYLDAIASLSSDGRRLYIIAVNRSFSNGLQTKVSLHGFHPRSTARAWVLTAPSLDANNGNDLPSIPGLYWAKQISAPRGSMFEQGRPGTVATRETSIANVSDSFSYLFPPMSVTALELTQ
jgi:alpha-N-arabinofuranosidase